MSRRSRGMVAGLAVVAVCVVVAGVVGPVWLLRRVFDAPPAAPAPVEYTGFQVTVTDGCLSIRNTGPDEFFTGQIHYRIARDDRAASWDEGDQAFVGWRPGEEIVIVLREPIPAGRLIQFAGTAQKDPAGREYRLRFGPAARPTQSIEDVGFDPDLAAATDGKP